MVEVYVTLKNITMESLMDDPRKRLFTSRLLKGLPKLNTVVLQEGSARRFSVARMSIGMRQAWVIPREDLLTRGGIVVISDGAGLTNDVDENLTHLVQNYPVSILNQGDIAWPRHGNVKNQDSFVRLGDIAEGVSIFDLPRGGSTVT